MKILFLHQNFPAQFRQLASHLAAQPGNEIMALKQPPERKFPGVGLFAYPFLNRPQERIHPLLAEMEAKVLRGESVAAVCAALRKKGWHPDVIVAHPGWGEALFVREIWPQARLVMYCEYYYRSAGQDFNCDPEFPQGTLAEVQKLKLKNTVMLHALADTDVAYTPTQWQRNTFPAWAQDKIKVVHEGINTDYYKPDPKACFSIANKGVSFKTGDEVITFAARSLEPVRGFHIFMRALPEILKKRKQAHIVIMGQAETTYGADPEGFATWSDRLLAEVGDKLDPKRVHIVGFLPNEQYRAILQVSKLHVYLTYPFLLSWSMLEAMACGAHIVASDTGPVREVIEDGKTGVLTPLFDSKTLAKTVIEQLQIPATRSKKLRTAARQWIQQNYGIDECLQATLALLGAPEKPQPAKQKPPAKRQTKPATAAKPAPKKKATATVATKQTPRKRGVAK